MFGDKEGPFFFRKPDGSLWWKLNIFIDEIPPDCINVCVVDNNSLEVTGQRHYELVRGERQTKEYRTKINLPSYVMTNSISQSMIEPNVLQLTGRVRDWCNAYEPPTRSVPAIHHHHPVQYRRMHPSPVREHNKPYFNQYQPYHHDHCDRYYNREEEELDSRPHSILRRPRQESPYKVVQLQEPPQPRHEGGTIGRSKYLPISNRSSFTHSPSPGAIANNNTTSKYSYFIELGFCPIHSDVQIEVVNGSVIVDARDYHDGDGLARSYHCEHTLPSGVDETRLSAQLVNDRILLEAPITVMSRHQAMLEVTRSRSSSAPAWRQKMMPQGRH